MPQIQYLLHQALIQSNKIRTGFLTSKQHFKMGSDITVCSGAQADHAYCQGFRASHESHETSWLSHDPVIIALLSP